MLPCSYSCFILIYLSCLYSWSLQGPRPSEFVIERTLDNGRTWEPALYLATDCEKAFPGIPTATPLRLDETYCYTLPPTEANPYQDHTVRKTIC